ncbi:MAG TPA: flavin-dependent dehydrogenase [Oscillatoriaceae cyanobacterium M33_DOE_052]|uniref:Flavin-dependent dehydrogenase n=1 Tax=Planktothricoides sp. SpSt-374 TaxID=2282167 RepID=A0A7C3VSE0_9CYAN|nr:flavin-dependent dehydrogenase [Oscillatoriaceae cyanobacterium M33_DOE_052]
MAAHLQEILYIEVPTPDVVAVRRWLQEEFSPSVGDKQTTPDGIRLAIQGQNSVAGEICIFVWSVQRTTYLKAFRWAETLIPGERQIKDQLTANIRQQFPHQYPVPPAAKGERSIFELLGTQYPQTVKYFQKIPNGEYDLNRAYWWEQRWRSSVIHPQQPQQVVFQTNNATGDNPEYDLIYIGGALGVIHAAVMAKLGYRVLLIERMPFGRMNREWNISRDEFQSLINLGLFTPAEFESVIAAEYEDGFHKFFDANNPPQCRAAILHTPTVLNVAIDAEKFLGLCGAKLRAAGGEIWDETEFQRADVEPQQVIVNCRYLPTGTAKTCTGRLLVDAMGTASPIAWQLNGKRAFDSVCPTVGAVISGGFPAGVWDSRYGDVLNSHGDISRGRQLIWELFPGEGTDLTIYLFHYHQIHPDNPGSLLEMYEDFFTILPEYRRCDMEDLVWKKATFGYIPGHFSVGSDDRTIAFDRLVAIGDAASLQSPLVFTGFGSLVRNLNRLTQLLDVALKHDLLSARHLNRIRAYQSNVAVTWLFSKGMMIPTGQFVPPARINSMLNTFFGILASEPPAVAEAFIKDRVDWFTFNRLALKAARLNPALLLWIWQLAGVKDLTRWLGSYLDFTLSALFGWLLAWLPNFTRACQPWLENRYPGLWFWLLAQISVPQAGAMNSHRYPQPMRKGTTEARSEVVN